MELLNFNENDLDQRLTEMSPTLRAAFAAACAQRLAQAYSAYAVRSNLAGRPHKDPDAVNKILASLWNDLTGNKMSDAELESLIDTSLGLIPTDEDEWIPGQGTADDAAAALAYALRYRRNGSSQDAIWAAQRAYDALDAHIINHENIDPNVPGGEDRIVAHPLMQAELSRQLRDLDELRDAKITIEQLRERSTGESADFLGGA